MNIDRPVTVICAHGDVTATAPFADVTDATTFIHAQARAADAAGHTDLRAVLTQDAGTPVCLSVHGHNITGAVVTALDRRDDDGFSRLRVAGIDAIVYAHRSQFVPGALVVGVDADDDQRIQFVVNDGDLVDTTVGVPTGVVEPTIDVAPTMQLMATIAAPTEADARHILNAAVCCQPIHFASLPDHAGAQAHRPDVA